MWRGFRRSAISILTSGKEFAVSDTVGPSPLSLGHPEMAKKIACVDDQRSVISDRLIVDRVVAGCHDDSIESFGASGVSSAVSERRL